MQHRETPPPTGYLRNPTRGLEVTPADGWLCAAHDDRDLTADLRNVEQGFRLRGIRGEAWRQNTCLPPNATPVRRKKACLPPNATPCEDIERSVHSSVTKAFIIQAYT